ncbi:tyrosine-type recombinase/integrase [bacterium]|nr:tyrosine-type recombinase/integrase [bacterium]
MHAVKKQLIPNNPFADLKSAPKPNPERSYFITRHDTELILEACPDAEWRVIVALARYGGLRVPSEVYQLKWEDIDWERGRILVSSPKTERYQGKESRVCPLYPELRIHLAELFEIAGEGTQYVVEKHRIANLRTQFSRIIKRAGLKQWPKLFQNLRSSRQTELEDSFPSHAVCAWMGNSEPIARKHYLQVTEQHFERATEAGAESGALALQNSVQHGLEESRTEPQLTSKVPTVQQVTRTGASCCDNTRNVKVGNTGLEPVTSTV